MDSDSSLSATSSDLFGSSDDYYNSGDDRLSQAFTVARAKHSQVPQEYIDAQAKAARVAKEIEASRKRRLRARQERLDARRGEEGAATADPTRSVTSPKKPRTRDSESRPTDNPLPPLREGEPATAAAEMDDGAARSSLPPPVYGAADADADDERPDGSPRRQHSNRSVGADAAEAPLLSFEGDDDDAADAADPADRETLREARPKLHVPIRYLTGRGGALRKKLMRYDPREEARRRRRHRNRHAAPQRQGSALSSSEDGDSARRSGSAADDDNEGSSGSAASSLSGARAIQRRQITLGGFDTLVAFRAAFDFQYFERPSGDLNVTDVLLSVLLFVEPDQATLIAISRVSRAWREASTHLPQWAVVPQLMYPAPGLIHFVNFDARNEIDGVDVASRDEYMTVMKSRAAAKRRARDYVRSRRVRLCLLNMRLITVCQFLGVLIPTLFIFAVNVGLAVGGVVSPQSSLADDSSLGALAFFMPMFLGFTAGIFYKFFVTCVRPMTNRHRNMRYRGEWTFLAAMTTVFFMIPCPLALVAARWYQAYHMLEYAPTVEFSSHACTNLTTFLPSFDHSWPSYVRLGNASEWRIEPWLETQTRPAFVQPAVFANGTTSETLNRALCDPAAARAKHGRTWWADQYLQLTNDTAAPDNAFFDGGLDQCYDVLMEQPGAHWHDYLQYTPGPQIRFLLLYPPESVLDECRAVEAAKHGDGYGPAAFNPVVAMPFVPSSSVFNNTVRKFWSRHAGAGAGDDVTTTFRAAVQSRWFRIPMGEYEGHQWFHATDEGLKLDELNRQSEWWRENDVPSAYLWQHQRVPLMVPDDVMAPYDLMFKWLVKMAMLIGLGVGFLVFACFCACLPRSFIGGAQLTGMFAVLLMCFVNVIWLMAWGGVCYFQDHPDACLMTKTSALSIFVTGWVFVLLAIGIAVAAN